MNFWIQKGLLSLQFYFLLLRKAVLSEVFEERVNQKSNPQWDLGKNISRLWRKKKRLFLSPEHNQPSLTYSLFTLPPPFLWAKG